MKRKWIRIEIRCGEETADEMAAEIAESFKVGVEILAEGIRLYLQEDLFVEEGERKLESILSNFRPLSGEREASSNYDLSTLEEEDWLEQWKRGFKPLRVGKHLVVAPTWEEIRRNDGDRVIRIDPGQAFGTGHHETTRLCLEWLEAWAGTEGGTSPKSLLDVGTGSGILAIAAALLGFERILALDNDPEAVRVARENLILNGVNDRIELREGLVEGVETCYGVVLANIQALPLIEMAPILRQRLERSGKLVLSGILLEQSEAVRNAYEALDIRLCSKVVAREWCLMEFILAKD